VSDHEAIAQVLARYGRGLDDRDFDAVADCFTPDAQATFSGVELAPGRDAIIAHVRGLTALAASTHLFGLPVIELAADGESAFVETTAVAHLVVDASVGPVRTRGLRYQDTFVRVHGHLHGGRGPAWRIRRRIHRVDWMTEHAPAGT
jgi:uncharacterized protein (TIGR02246 family)